MAGSSRTRSGVGNMLAFLPNPSPIVLAKFWVCRSCMIGTGKIDEPRRFSEVTKEDGWGPHNLGTGVAGELRKEEARQESGEAEQEKERP